MSDLTTANLKQLLDEAAPGPWESSASEYGVPEGWDEYWLALHMGYTRLSTMERDDPPPEEAYASLDLAALAPELAQEVIRMRLELSSMRHAWEDMSTNPARTPTEQNLAAHVLVHIGSILGENQ
nr:MAG TPA: hypothetical protein [Caudoviricetes sp.]